MGMIYLILVFQVLSVCFSKDQPVSAIQLIRQYPINTYQENSQEKVEYLRDTADIIYYKDYILYKLPGTIQFENGYHISGTEPYFLMKRGAVTGKLFSSFDDTGIGVSIPVDTFLRKNLGRGQDFDVPDAAIWQRSYSKQIQGSNITVDAFSIIKNNPESVDTIIYHYAPILKDIDFTLSKRLDAERQSKLFKVLFIINEQMNVSSGKLVPRREFKFEIREYRPVNQDQLVAFIAKRVQYL